MTKRGNLQKKKPPVLLIGGIALAVVGIVIFLLMASNQPTNNAVTATTIIEDAERATHHELATVQEAGQMLLTLINVGELHLTECPTVRIFGNLGTMQPNSNNIAVGVVPSTGTDEAGNLVLSEDIGFTSQFWNQIPESDRWSYLWHEMQHVKQDCILLETAYRETGLSGEELWLEFDSRWQTTAGEKEAYPLAVQAYWQNHGYGVVVFPALLELMRQSPGAWENNLPLDDNGVPIGIELQLEWPDWVELVERIYVIR